MMITKLERDQFSGDVEQDNKKVTEFKFRSLPGVGLVIMSCFELYQEYLSEDAPAQNISTSISASIPEPVSIDADSRIQRLIDERLMLHDLIGQVVDKKIMHKEAIHQMVLAKLTDAVKLLDEKMDSIHSKTADIGFVHAVANDLERKISGIAEKAAMAEVKAEVAKSIASKAAKKPRPLQTFLEKKKQKVFNIPLHLTKSESVSCPDCGKEIFNYTGFNGCICYGSDMYKKVVLKKTEQGIKISFPKSWDEENITMLLEVLRKR